MVDRLNSLVIEAVSRLKTMDFAREDGQALTEYALVLGVIVAAVVVALTTIGGKVHSEIQNVCTALVGSSTGCP